MLVFDNSFASVVEGIKISRTYVRTLQRIFQFSLAAPLPVLAISSSNLASLPLLCFNCSGSVSLFTLLPCSFILMKMWGTASWTSLLRRSPKYSQEGYLSTRLPTAYFRRQSWCYFCWRDPNYSESGHQPRPRNGTTRMKSTTACCSISWFLCKYLESFLHRFSEEAQKICWKCWKRGKISLSSEE